MGWQLGHQNIGLLVEQNNVGALALYLQMSFKIQNEKEFMSGLYHHMVFGAQASK